MDDACENTDRELWRDPDDGNGDYYADSIFMTKDGSLGINCGGSVYVKTLREWHRLAGGPISGTLYIGAGVGAPVTCACCKQQVPRPDCEVPGCAFR